MKSLKKYAPLLVLLGVVTAVQAEEAAPPPKNLSPSEMRVKTEAFAKEIEGDHRHVLHLQALARKSKDVIKLTCINDKLVQLNAQMNMFDTAKLQLEGAISATDDSPKAIFADVEKANTEVKRLRSEADGCAGELEMYKQESKTGFERPDLDDPTDTGDGFDGNMDDDDIDVPGFATPYR